ncbi:ribosomal protein uL16 3-hydroxylase [Lacisediminimonas profundi]|uniref:ribosomal protein uL16 3-hydroxylase n=1 Tax=Lacisediminimonas profundi TaxID=2603856 RepID=UPI00124B44C5|nr:cupin domain-containing protein [Lacisediminimonas profundi]
MKKLTLLGGLTPASFLKEYWHKKPLLIRQAIPGFTAPLSRDELFALAQRDDVESRLITHFAGKWKLTAGPLPELPPTTRRNWTTLVQGVNLHDDRADALLGQFRFLPDARLDDLMISYATDGGGVGPHFDSYDVFLLQAHGQRRWSIGRQRDLTLVKGLPLKVLQNFEPEEEYVLEPGDMLYLPPHYAHDGIAVGECMTYSIGFRAPAWQELAESFLQFMSDTVELPGRYADPDLQPAKRPAELPAQMVEQVSRELQRIRFDRDDISLFLGEYLSSPKPQVFFESPARPLSPAKFADAARRRGVRLSPRSRMLYAGSRVFINGESFDTGPEDRAVLRLLADQRMLSGEQAGQASPDVSEALCTWYEDGWLLLA